MSSPRLATYPIEHVLAELTAFPFVSMAAFEMRLTNLNAFLEGGTGALWREAEQELVREFPSTSLDEIHNLRDSIWFRRLEDHEDSSCHLERSKQCGTPFLGHLDSETLGEYLHRLACRRLDLRGTKARPVLRKHLEEIRVARDGEARWLMRWMAFALPPDLLLSALEDTGNLSSRPEEICRVFGRMLMDAGFAQPHVHLNAAFTFSDYWVATLHRLAESDCRGSSFASPGAVFNEGRYLGEWLLRAAIARQLLAAFLAWQSQGDHAGDTHFTCYMDASVRRAFGSGYPDCLHACLSLIDAKLHGNYPAIQSSYAQLTQVLVHGIPKRAGDIQHYDPIALTGVFTAGGHGDLTPEMRFTAAGLRYLRTPHGQGDQTFATLFWQVIRIRGLFYRHVTQRPMTPGLQWFMNFYRRLKAGRPRNWPFSLQLDLALHLEGMGKGLQAFEFRAAPGSASEIRSAILDCETRRANLLDEFHSPREGEKNANTLYSNNPPMGAPLEFGLVLHFTKHRGGASDEGRFAPYWRQSHAHPFPTLDPRQEISAGNTGFRYQIYYREQRQRALAIGSVLLEWPLSLTVLRGLDTCTDEQGVPTWVMVPLFRYAKECGRLASGWVRKELGWPVPGLRSTAHAGEDFVHLLGGMRRIDEVIQYLPLGEGDRLGHGLALGIDPLEWARRTGMVVMAKEERLLDLAWEWDIYRTDAETRPSQQRLVFLEAELQRLSSELFRGIESPFHPRTIKACVERMHDEAFLVRVGFPDHPRPLSGQAPLQDKLAYALLTSPGVFERGRQLIPVDTEREGEFLLEVQNSLRRRVGRLGITVEVNPTSNLLIGDLSDLKRHPLWRLDPPEPVDDVPPISICIGSDDPLTFATALRQEYQLLIDAMVQAGLSQEAAYRWIHRVRRNGLSSRFTLPIARPVPIMEHPGPTRLEASPMP